MLCLLGLLLGAVLLSAGMVLLEPWLAANYGLFLERNWLSGRTLTLMGGIFAAAFVLALIPALGAYRRALADGLSIKF